MPSEKQPFYDPVPPTYDEALAGSSSRRREEVWSQRDEREAPNTESESLLRQAGSASASSSRRPNGYRPPTVETDDEDSLFDGLSSDDEEDEVRQEMEEMDIEEPESTTSRWRKRIPFGLSLPRFKWPSFPRVRIQLPSGPGGGESSGSTNDDNNTNNNSESTTTGPMFTWPFPKVDSVTVLVTVARLLALFILLGFFFFLFTSGLLVSPSQSRGAGRYPPASVEHHILNNIKPETLRQTMEHYSKYAHIAGTQGGEGYAYDMEKMLRRARIPYIEVDKYEVYLNYPREGGRAVELLDASGEHVEFSAVLEEDERHVESSGHQTFVFHGLSRAGDVKGPLIYANYGSRRDFEKLKEAGIDMKGAIALVRYYGPVESAGLKVKAAEAAGFAGCLIYSDPADDGFKKSKEAPDGSGMPKGAVHRDTVALSHLVMGDVLTPGWESVPGQPRMQMQDVHHMVNIPSLPLSWRDAEILLKRLKGHGEMVPENWKGAVPDVEWWTGNVTSPIVRLRNEQDEEKQQEIRNVYGKILGVEQGRKSIIIGNRRDAWSFGATDPHSGTAIMVELARIFGDLYEFGWRPLRTIEFMSWDGGAYNNIGSTEYVEKNLERLRTDAFAYIDLNAAVSGREFRASGSPIFRKILLSALDRVQDPLTSKPMRQLWEERHGELENLGTSSDYVAFQNLAGTSSLHLEFSGAVFPRHSSFDTHDVVEMHVDPGFQYHVAMAKIVSFVLYELADLNILQFDLRAYGDSLGRWVNDLQRWIGDQPASKDKEGFSLDELRQAVDLVKDTVTRFETWEQEWRAATRNSRGWEDEQITQLRMAYNDRMAQFETALLDMAEFGGGLPGRNQFKHMVFGPQLWPERKDAYFPLIRDAVVDGNYTVAQEGVKKVAEHIRAAARVLEGAPKSLRA